VVDREDVHAVGDGAHGVRLRLGVREPGEHRERGEGEGGDGEAGGTGGTAAGAGDGGTLTAGETDVLAAQTADAAAVGQTAEGRGLVVTEVVEDETMHATHQGVTLRPTTYDGPLRVAGDHEELSRLVANLVSNAVKFSDQGGAIMLKTARSGAEVVISVQDEGMGIAPEDRERIFQRFERVETGITGRTVGTGLGLAIVSEIANLHHGRVNVESAIGEGSTFSITLPILAP
jgi:signal transduction histidine kinase